MLRDNMPVCVESINAMSILNDDYPESVLRVVDLTSLYVVFKKELLLEGYDDITIKEIAWLFKAVSEMCVLYGLKKENINTIVSDVQYELSITLNRPSTERWSFIGVHDIEEAIYDIVTIYVDLTTIYKIVLVRIGVVTEWGPSLETMRCYILIPGGITCVQNSHFTPKQP